VLIAMARHELPANARHLLDELLGDPTLDDSQVQMLQETIRDSGAIEKVEAVIDRNVALALDTIAHAPLSPSAKQQLVELADTVVKRSA
jgi:geranylgeranyl diphosphate synthase type I